MGSNEFLKADTSNLKPLVIFGSGGHAVSVANVALSCGYKIECFIDKRQKSEDFLGYKVKGDIAEVENADGFVFAIAVGDNAVREKLYSGLVKVVPNLYFPPLIHSSAVVSFFSEIGDGTVVMPNAVIGPNSKVGNFCLVNTNASLDHDCTMLDYSSLAPGAVTGGKVTIGLRSVICIGAIIKHDIDIGDDCIVGANSYLNQDLPSNQLAYGTPARKVRVRKAGEVYLK